MTDVNVPTVSNKQKNQWSGSASKRHGSGTLLKRKELFKISTLPFARLFIRSKQRLCILYFNDKGPTILKNPSAHTKDTDLHVRFKS
jgi:hypothetical protein